MSISWKVNMEISLGEGGPYISKKGINPQNCPSVGGHWSCLGEPQQSWSVSATRPSERSSNLISLRLVCESCIAHALYFPFTLSALWGQVLNIFVTSASSTVPEVLENNKQMNKWKTRKRKNVPSHYHLWMGKFPFFKMWRSLVLAINFMKLYQNCQYLTTSFCNLIPLHCRMDWGAKLKRIIWVCRVRLDCGTLGNQWDWL